jgi:signal transduction histidine kinase
MTAGAGAMVVGLIALIGWIAGLPVLTRIHPTWAPLRLNGAFGYLALGIALILMATERRGFAAAAGGMGGIALMIGAATLTEYGTGQDLGIDQLFVVEDIVGSSHLFPGRIAPVTALTLVLLGLAFVAQSTGTRRFAWVSLALVIPALLLVTVALLGYLFGASGLYTAFSTISGVENGVSLHAAVASVLVGTGLMLICPDTRMIRAVASPGPGGVMLRKMLPLAVLVPSIVVHLRVWGEADGLLTSTDGAATAGVSIAVCMAAVLFLCAASIDRFEAARLLEQHKVAGLNAAVAQRVIELEAANKELEAFSYTVSHDLRTPLRAIDGFSRILSEDHAASLDDEGQRLLRVILDGAHRMNQLIEDILAFSRMGRVALSTREIDMPRLVGSVTEDLRAAAPGRTLVFTIGPLPNAQGDCGAVRQVWANLVANAIKYTARNQTASIEIGARTTGAEVVYFIRDDGIGFDMQYADKLFGVFQRLHGSDEFAGTGIGLAIARRIVTRHGGRIWAEGAVDRGATFSFTLAAGAGA